MADAKQLKVKIQSTQNIKKITWALEIISTLKLQKVKKHTVHLRDCMVSLIDIVAKIDSYKHLFDIEPSAKYENETMLIVIGTEKWLCWSLNTQLFKHIHSLYDGKQATTDIVVIGKKAKEYFARRGYNVIETLHVSDSINIESAQNVVHTIHTHWSSATHKNIILCYNVFKNTMKYIPSLLSLFPMRADALALFLEEVLGVDIHSHTVHAPKDLIIEPSLLEVKKKLYEMIVHYVIYWAIYQNKTCEFASRMLAMKGAKDNALTQINGLTLSYNKARQDAITKEIIEVAWARAVVN